MTLDRTETFWIDQQGFLVREVVPRSGAGYQHRCPLSAYEIVAHACEDSQSGFTLDELVDSTRLPHTQVAVALAFMKERCSIERAGKRNYPSTGLHLDALIEYHALRENTTT